MVWPLGYIKAFHLLIGTESHRLRLRFPFRSPPTAARFTLGAAYALRAIPYGKGYITLTMGCAVCGGGAESVCVVDGGCHLGRKVVLCYSWMTS